MHSEFVYTARGSYLTVFRMLINTVYFSYLIFSTESVVVIRFVYLNEVSGD